MGGADPPGGRPLGPMGVKISNLIPQYVVGGRNCVSKILWPRRHTFTPMPLGPPAPWAAFEGGNYLILREKSVRSGRADQGVRRTIPAAFADPGKPSGIGLRGCATGPVRSRIYEMDYSVSGIGAKAPALWRRY